METEAKKPFLIGKVIFAIEVNRIQHELTSMNFDIRKFFVSIYILGQIQVKSLN